MEVVTFITLKSYQGFNSFGDETEIRFSHKIGQAGRIIFGHIVKSLELMFERPFHLQKQLYLKK